MKTYRVKEIFRTLQGEGLYAGSPAVFVRFVGCNLWSGQEMHRERDHERSGALCPLWCDTDFTRAGSRSLRVGDILNEAQALLAAAWDPLLVCTGGEPLLALDEAFIFGAHAEGFRVHVETNGTVPLPPGVHPDWITVSPKYPDPERLQIRRCDELKVVFPAYDPLPFEEWADGLPQAEESPSLLYVQPLDPLGGSFYDLVTGASIPNTAKLERWGANMAQTVEWLMDHPHWSLSLQTHKFLNLP